MAHLVRPAKSGNDWTLNDLDSYHISLNPVEPLSFFDLKVGDHRSVKPLVRLTTLRVSGVATTLGS